MYFDTHAHLFPGCCEEPLTGLFDRLLEGGTDSLVLCGYDLKSSESACRTAEKYDGYSKGQSVLRIFTAVGIHPEYVSDDLERDVSGLRRLISICRVDALGEFGLDCFAEKKQGKPADRQRQRAYFKAQLELCGELGLLALIHSREAAKETYDTLAEYPRVRGVIHGFSYSAQMALMFARLGWHIGVGSAVLRPGARRIKEAVAVLPGESILAETDSPFQKGDIEKVVEQISIIRGMTPEDTQKLLYENGNRLFEKGAEGAPDTNIYESADEGT